jgi:AraC family transcriptional regulator
MSTSAVPVTMGSQVATMREVGPFQLTRATFPAGATIPPHVHDRTCIAFMLGGSFDLRFHRGRQFDCLAGTVFIEPAGETHCNCMGCAGARVLVLQPDHDSELLPAQLMPVLSRPAHFTDPGLFHLARRLQAELHEPDPVSALMLEGLSLEVTALLARERLPKRNGRPPHWLSEAEALVRARFATPLTVAGVAREVGVHPSHLARTFRHFHRCSIGRFVRRLRMEWAAHQLAVTDRTIAAIATRAGFSDQSHFTRRFREQVGVTPHRWRRSHRGDGTPPHPSP